MISRFPPYDLLAAGEWHSALFTTFSLSLAFFEAVPLHALRRSGTKSIGIIADLAGYQASLSESGVADVGRSYDLIPLKVPHGCFHPKITLLAGEEGVRATVGSGNLTFGGWGRNIEAVEYLTPERTPECFADLAEFLDYLDLHINEGEILASCRPSNVQNFAEICRQASRRPGDGSIRLLHTFLGPIAAQLAARAEELGGATQLTVVSPFFGGPGAVRDLALTLRCDRVRVCVTGQAPEYFDFAAARKSGVLVAPVRSDAFAPDRLLHAKIIEVICRKGRLTLAGSANATKPALWTAGNVEASVLRIVDDSLSFGWLPADPVPLDEGLGGQADTSAGPCLSARFDGVGVSGRLFGCVDPAGLWEARLAAGVTDVALPKVIVGKDGTFKLRSELGANWYNLVRASQLILTRSEAEVRGWLVFDQILDAVRERGHLAEAMIRMLAGSEEPDDLAVILSFFAANPSAFMGDDAGPLVHGTGGAHAAQPATGLVDLAQLQPVEAYSDCGGAESAVGGASAFDRLLTSLRRHVNDARRPTAALADADDVDDFERLRGSEIGAVQRWQVDAVIEALADFVDMLPADDGNLRRHIVSLLDFILFAAERSDEPEEARTFHLRRWVKIARCAKSQPGEPDALDRAFVAVALSRAIEEPKRAAQVHSWLQERCGGVLTEDWIASVVPSALGIRERRLAAAAEVSIWVDTLRTVTSTQTSWMNVRKVRLALAGEGPLPSLPAGLEAEAAAIEKVFNGSSPPDRILLLGPRRREAACPKCFFVLPRSERDRLRANHMVLAPCCHRVILDPSLE